MTSELSISQSHLLDAAMHTFLAGRNAHTERAYNARLSRFMDWLQDEPPAPFVAHLKDYIVDLQHADLAPRSIQAHLTTIKGFLRTAAALDETGQLTMALPSLDLVKAPKVRGEIQGNRLTDAEAQRLIALPGIETCKGMRDTAILALMAYCGLRRSEVCKLNWKHIADLDGVNVIKDLHGKHGRVRTIKLPPQLHNRIIDWGNMSEIDMSPDAPVFVAVRKGDAVQHGQRLPESTVGYLVTVYARLMDRKLSPHDLRRTAAKLARKGGASIEQVQIMLGHAKPQTTSAYIGDTLNLEDHAVDYINVRMP